MTKEEIQQLVRIKGTNEHIEIDDFEWNDDENTFSANTSLRLVIDFSKYNGFTIICGGECTIISGADSNIKCRNHCHIECQMNSVVECHDYCHISGSRFNEIKAKSCNYIHVIHDATITCGDSNIITCGSGSKVVGNNSNTINCTDESNITCGGDNIIIGRSNNTITCHRNNKIICERDNNKIICDFGNNIECGSDNTIECGDVNVINCGEKNNVKCGNKNNIVFYGSIKIDRLNTINLVHLVNTTDGGVYVLGDCSSQYIQIDGDNVSHDNPNLVNIVVDGKEYKVDSKTLDNVLAAIQHN